MKKVILLLIAILPLLFVTCKKDDVQVQPISEAPIGDFPDEVVKKFDILPSVDIKLEDVLLPNGKTIKEYLISKNTRQKKSLKTNSRSSSLQEEPIEAMDLFVKMSSRAIALVTRQNFKKKEDDGALQNGYPNPKQDNGLAYVWKGKTETVRSAPNKVTVGRTEVIDATCRSNLFGFDCSGLLSTILRAGGLQLGVYNADQLSEANNINKFLLDGGIDDVVVEDLGTNFNGPWQTGDIIYGKFSSIHQRYQHIGIILKDKDGQLAVFVSNGGQTYSCSQNTDPNRGPRTLSKSDYKSTFTGTIGYLRFKMAPKIESASSTFRTGNINDYLPDSVKVRVVDGDGNGLRDIPVGFFVKSGGGSVDQILVATNNEGYAGTKWKLGSENGSQVLEVSANKDGRPLNNSPIIFTANNLQGTPGDPRFNLQFTNGSQTDLDLYVQTPDGSIIYYGNLSAQNGTLDLDCYCESCPNGPNENIFWTPGTAPTGTYKVWVEYFGDCDGSNVSSNYTITILKNSTTIQTYTGTLSPANIKSPVYSFEN